MDALGGLEMSPRPVSLPKNLEDSRLADEMAVDEARREVQQFANQLMNAISKLLYELDKRDRNQIRRMQEQGQRRDGKLAYRISEVAKLTGISEASVVRAIDRGELRAVKLNAATDTSARLILAADLERWLLSLPER